MSETIKPPPLDCTDQSVWDDYLDKVNPMDNPNTWTLSSHVVYTFSNDKWYSKRVDPEEPPMDYLDMYDAHMMHIEVYEEYIDDRGRKKTRVKDFKLDPDIESARWKRDITEYHPLEYRAFPNLEKRCALSEWERDGDARVYDPWQVVRGHMEFENEPSVRLQKGKNDKKIA